jgi:hypothetical protein
MNLPVGWKTRIALILNDGRVSQVIPCGVQCSLAMKNHPQQNRLVAKIPNSLPLHHRRHTTNPLDLKEFSFPQKPVAE